MKIVNLILLTLFAFIFIVVSPVLGIIIVDNSGSVSFVVGNLSQNYTLQANVTSNIIQANDTNVTFYMPWGIYNITPCNGASGFTQVNTTHVSCEISIGTISMGNTTQANLTVKTNISAFVMYGTHIFNYSAICDDCSANSTLSAFTATNFWKNPRPDAVRQDGTGELLFTGWNQTDFGYKVMSPIMIYNDTAGRPQFANNTFGEILFFDKSFFEFPTFMRLFTYNLTFRIIYDGAPGNATFIIRSPINSSQTPEQSLVPIYVRTEEQTDFTSNNTFNMTMGVPSATGGFTVYLNGTNYTDTQLLGMGVNISFNFGGQGSPDQSVMLLRINAANTTLVNNTDISVLFTMLNATACGSSGICSVSPIFVKSQQLSGWAMDEPPKFGESVNQSFLINVTNILANYTLDNLSVSFMQPMNVTMTNATNSSQMFGQFNMTKNVNISVWNGTAFVENENVIVTNSNITFTENMGPNAGTMNITIFLTTYDVLLSNSTHPTTNGWTPGSNPYAWVNFSASITFPTIEETNYTPGTAGTSNSYNATISTSQRAPLNLTGKVPGLNSDATNVNVTFDGTQMSSSNYTLGSLIINDVNTGTHVITVSYTVPTASTPPTTTTITSGGGGGGATVSDKKKKTMIFSKITPGAASIFKQRNDEVGLKQIEIYVFNSVNNVKITVEKFDTKPATATKEISEPVYEYLDIKTENLEDNNIKQVIITFNITKEWMNKNSFRTDEIILKRLKNDTWQSLETILKSQGTSDLEYEATSPGFSVFAVTGEKKTILPVNLCPSNCSASSTTCPDGFMASCQNICDPNTGICGTCTPDCAGHTIQPSQKPQTTTQTATEEEPPIDTSLISILIVIIVLGALFTWYEKKYIIRTIKKT